MKPDARRPFVVVCKKYSGRETPFDRYAVEAEARAVVDRLREVGCSARLIDERFQRRRRSTAEA